MVPIPGTPTATTVTPGIAVPSSALVTVPVIVRWANTLAIL